MYCTHFQPLDLPWSFQSWPPRSSAQRASPVCRHLSLSAALLPSCSAQKLAQTLSHPSLCQHKKNTHMRSDHVIVYSEVRRKESIRVYQKNCYRGPAQHGLQRSPENDPLSSLSEWQAERPERLSCSWRDHSCMGQ